MRGTGYAVFEIILWMLIAGLIGVAVGWILRAVFGGSQRVAEMERKLESEKGRYAKLSESLAVKKKELKASLSDVDAAQADLARTRESAASLEEELMKVRADLADARREAETDVAASGSDTAEAPAEVARLGSRVRELEAELASATTALDDLAVVHAACAVDADERAGVIAAKEAEIARLSDEVAGFAGLQSATQDKLTELADAEQRLAEAAIALEECRTASAHAARRVEELERSLEQQIAFELDASSWQRGTTSLGTPGAGHRDDLKVINGVGPALEELLNSFGIQSWEQLATLTEAEVARVDAALDEFPGRIHRDEWVAQARDLVERFPDAATRPDRDTYLNEAPPD